MASVSLYSRCPAGARGHTAGTALVGAGLLVATLARQVAPEAQIDRVVAGGIRDGVYPGAVVVIGTRDSVLLSRGYGRLSWSASSGRPDPERTRYDLASLTKVVALVPATMLLVESGRLDLDRSVQHYLPEFSGPGKERVTVRHLLEHRSGLRAFLPLNERASTAEEARRLVLAEPLRFRPGGRVVYSDLNAMLLGWIVEQVAAQPLDRFVSDQVYAPLGMARTGYRLSRAAQREAAPVGIWRGHVIAGQLHDQNAVRLGGVSGHAGLYSTGADLARYAQLWLRVGQMADGRALFSGGTVRHFTARGPAGRALGWEMRDTLTVDSVGALLSDAAYGHGGFTGTSIWIDPDHQLFVIMLTNRVFAPRTRNSIGKLKQIRGRLADLAVELRGTACGAAGASGAARC